MPEPNRPSGAPLSESEADRLSERFTASWDEPEAQPARPPVAAPAPAAAPVVAKPKQTLLGIAPIVVGDRPLPPPPPAPPPPIAAPSAAPAAAPSTAPAAMAPVTAASVAPVASTTPTPYGPPVALSTPPSSPTASSPDASSVARGLTTPSKPYIPKDDPSTPAVVISEALVAPAPRPDRARIAQTIPAQTRSAPAASVAPPAALPSSSPVATLDDTYPLVRGAKSKLPLIVGAAIAVGIALIAVIKLSSGDEPATSAATTSSAAAAPKAAEPVPTEAVAAAPTSAPTPEPVAAPAEPPSTPAQLGRVEPEPTRKTKPVLNTKRPAPGAAAPRKPTKAESRPAPATEPAPAPAAKPAKGVIVRETPF